VNRSTAEVERVVDVPDGSALARCAPDPGAFLEHTWGRHASVEHRVDERGFADLLTLDDVDRMLSTTALRTPAFRLVRADDTIPESAYTRSGRTGSKPVDGMADPARIFDLFGEGATIVLQGLHRYWEPVNAFTRALELELGHPCQVNAYVTPPGAQGLALHDDPHDVFVLQAFGSKRWEIHAAPGEERRRPRRSELRPGDVIYMPKGTGHAASTQESLSGHLTVGVHLVTWRDVTADAWKRVEAEPSLDEPLPPAWFSDRKAFAEEVDHWLEAVRGALDRVDARELADARTDRFLSTRPRAMRGALVDSQRLALIEDATEVRRRPGSVCEVLRRDGRLIVLLGDRRLEMPAWLEPALRRIAVVERLHVADLADDIVDRESRTVLIRRLVREGLLQLPAEL
jgi:lysine-specific demethylase/histidyl-hydroxylase NO66